MPDMNPCFIISNIRLLEVDMMVAAIVQKKDENNGRMNESAGFESVHEKDMDEQPHVHSF